MRCAALGADLIDAGAEVVFVCRELKGNYNDWLEARGFRVLHLPPPNGLPWHVEAGSPPHANWLGVPASQDAADVVDALESEPPLDWMIVDHFSLAHSWERSIRSVARRVVAIDGQGDRRHDCDVVIDPNVRDDRDALQAQLVPPHCVRLVGPEFALLRREFREIRASIKPRTPPIRRIIVTFGGSDPTRETLRTLRILQPIVESRNLMVDVAVGGANNSWDELVASYGSLPNISLHRDVSGIANMMARADLAIGAGGGTALERYALMLPAIAIATARNQEAQLERLKRAGGVDYLGSAASVTDAEFRASIERALEERGDGQCRDDWTGLVDGEGTLRVTRFLLAERPL
jgi:UDP-2,4-diacetamido-2,4,6-trideoxy-beta-L-altropyranose hydrolase